MSISDEQLATEIVERLNRLLEDVATREAIECLMSLRAVVSEELYDHPAIQVRDGGAGASLSFLGLLNGIVGRINGGFYDGWGHVTAHFDDATGRLLRFTRTASTPAKEEA